MGKRVHVTCPIEPSDLTLSGATLLRWERSGGVCRVLGRDDIDVPDPSGYSPPPHPPGGGGHEPGSGSEQGL